MREGWVSAKLADLCEFRNGLWTGKKPPFVNVGVIRNTNFRSDGSLDDSNIAFLDVEQKQFEKRRLQFGDLILEKSGGGPNQPVGRVIFFDKRDGHYSFSNFTSVIRVLDPSRLDFHYLHRVLYWYYVSGVTETMQRRSTGIRNLEFSAYKNLDVPLPPLPEQKRIVAILDEAFAGIATAVANTEKNLANARELFESHLNSVFSQRGEGWELKRLGEVAEHCLGKMLDKQKNKGTLKPYLRNINVRWFEVDTSDMLQMRIEDHEVSRYSVQKGDLLICEGGYPGRAALWERNEAAFFQKALHRVRCSDPRYNRWILYYLYFQDSVGALRKFFTGAGIQHLTGKALANLQVIWPPVSQLDGLLAGISVWQEEVTRLEGIYTQKLAALAELKHSLLKKAFAGELTTAPQDEIETALA
jgi:type I restriction enzyme, S subunit